MTVKLLLLNGPPKSGKDSLAREVEAYSRRLGLICQITKLTFADPLRRCLFSGMRDYEYAEWKNTVCPVMGVTGRELMIQVAESAIKPTMGKDFFAKIAVAGIKRVVTEYAPKPVEIVPFIITDLGMSEELDTICGAFGAANVMVAQIERKGCSFEGDSRGYVCKDGVKTKKYANKDVDMTALAIYTDFIIFSKESANG